jgi:hypothetical protein
MTITLPAKTLPVPARLAALETWNVEPFGPLVRHDDVAEAFRCAKSTLRKWRALGTFPEPAHKKSTLSFYRVADLVAPYYFRFPGDLPDEPPDPLGRFFAVALETADNEQQEVGTPLEGMALETPHPETSGNAVSYDVKGRSRPVSLQEAFRNELTAVVRDAVGEALENQPKAVPEPPPIAVIEALSVELVSQRQEIEALKAQLIEAETARDTALRWREKTLLDRLRKA